MAPDAEGELDAAGDIGIPLIDGSGEGEPGGAEDPDAAVESGGP
jgi:hypothetical protein